MRLNDTLVIDVIILIAKQYFFELLKHLCFRWFCDNCDYNTALLDNLKNHIKANHKSMKYSVAIIVIVRQYDSTTWKNTLKPNRKTQSAVTM